MNNEYITLLYKYFPLRKGNKDDLYHIMGVLEDNSLYFSRLSDFNDPFDCYPIYQAPDEDFLFWKQRISEKYTKGELEIIENNWNRNIGPKELIEQMRKKVPQHISDELGICCFSAKSDNLLMWAHYASYHTGVCFEFQGAHSRSFFREALPVDYKPARPVVNIFKWTTGVSVDMFLTKSLDWEYEAEYRIIGPNREPGRTHKFPKECLTGIILGARIEQENEVVLTKLINKNNSILLKKANLDDNEYKINIEPFGDNRHL